MKVAVTLFVVLVFVSLINAQFFDPNNFETPESEITTVSFTGSYFFQRLTGQLFSAIPLDIFSNSRTDGIIYDYRPRFFDFYWTTYWSSVRSFRFNTLTTYNTFSALPDYYDASLGSNWYVSSEVNEGMSLLPVSILIATICVILF